MDEGELMGVGGHPALALLNSTVQPLKNGPTIELLGDGAALLKWMAATDLVTEIEATEIRSRYSDRTLDRVARDVIELREWFRAVLPRVLDDQSDLTEVVDHVNDLLAKTNIHHCTTAEVIVKNPARAIPNAATDSARRKWVRVSIIERPKKPRRTKTAPTRMIRFVPQRPSARPCAGPSNALPVRVPTNAKEKSVFDQPKCRRSSTARLPNPCIHNIDCSAHKAALAPTIFQPV